MTNGEAAEAFRTRWLAEKGSSRLWLKQMTTEFKQRLTVEIGIEMARLSPGNQSMCLRRVPLLTETPKEEQREEEGKMKDLLSILSPGQSQLFPAFAPGSIFDPKYDRDGLAWDFLRAGHRRAVRLRIEEEEPYLVLGTPPCVELTDLFHNLRAHKVDPQVVRQRSTEAEILLRFACDIYEMQMAMKNHFLHEHPAGADSWKTPWVHTLQRSTYISACMAVPSNRRNS